MFLKFLEYISEYGEGSYSLYQNKSGDKFWGNVGAGVLPIDINSGKILLSYRSKYVNEPHTWGIWGGKLDEEVGEKDVIKVAKREFVEETSYIGNIQLKPAYIFKSDNGSFTYYNFIGLINEFKPQLDWETEKYEWLTYNELLKIKPKHFGLESLLNDKKSLSIIKKYI